MLYDVRTYVCRAGTLRAHLALYAEHGFDTQRHHLGEPFGYFITETGDVNSYLHIWAYRDAADRTQRRTALMADPAWLAYLKLSSDAGYLISQNNALMLEAAFSRRG